MTKRIFDLLVSIVLLLLTSPIIFVFMLLIFLQDFKNPFYLGVRIGKNELPFKMIKLRSMVANADKSGVTSTSGSDKRITPIGLLIRKLKLDEIVQLINVVKGDMSLVGPRPNVMAWGVELYTDQEKQILTCKPGITDFASIVFSDEGDILEGSKDPDLTYNQLIRPWKSRLGLIYIDHQNIWLDVQLILFTVLAIFSKKKALSWLVAKLKSLNVDEKVILVSARKEELEPYPPPGSSEVIFHRNIVT